MPPSEHESRHGEKLATKNHDVIQHWADGRNATPATVDGAEHGGKPGGAPHFDF